MKQRFSAFARTGSRWRVLAWPCLFVLGACSATYDPLADYEQLNPATQLEPPSASASSAFSAEQVAHGRYVVGLLGCGSCHTNGALVGAPNMEQLLAGSDTGIAWTNPLAEPNPGVVYPANITPDLETGIGAWSVDQIVAMIRSGVDRHAGQALPVMPWPAYAQLHEEDAVAIAAYLLSLPPVRHRVPDNVQPGRRATSPYVHFGVYQSRQ
jgi:mono/diheme cytochrome c family protein